EALYMHDPDGLGIEVYADRPRETWTWQGDQVVMTVDHLDFRDLARAAVEPWDGLPSGTTIGHVHLHVGDLDQALAFYKAGLGLEETARLPGAAFLAAGRYHHHLGINIWAAAAPSPHEDDAQLLEWSLSVPDKAAASARPRSARRCGSRSRAGRPASPPPGSARAPGGPSARRVPSTRAPRTRPTRPGRPRRRRRAGSSRRACTRGRGRSR